MMENLKIPLLPGRHRETEEVEVQGRIVSSVREVLEEAEWAKVGMREGVADTLVVQLPFMVRYGGNGGGGGSFGDIMIAGDKSFPAPGGGNETGHSGNGYARITLVE